MSQPTALGSALGEETGMHWGESEGQRGRSQVLGVTQQFAEVGSNHDPYVFTGYLKDLCFVQGPVGSSEEF